jgi:hypothetical protein
LIAFELLPLTESARFLGIGLCVGAAYASALLAEPEVTFRRGAFYTISAVALLRWIPWSEVRVGREVFVILGALLVLAAFRRAPARAPAPHCVTAFGIAIAVLAALVTPAIPLRTVAFPYVVALLAWMLRLRRARGVMAGTLVIAGVMTLFPWSGVVARGLPFLLIRHRPERPREGIHVALAPAKSFDMQLPPNAESLIVSGANASRLRRGTIIGWIDPGHVPLRIGDVADWGAMRRQHWFTSRVAVPRNPAGKIRDCGYSAWVDGAGRVPLPVRSGAIRITADPGLPQTALLQIESVELTGQ